MNIAFDFMNIINIDIMIIRLYNYIDDDEHYIGYEDSITYFGQLQIILMELLDIILFKILEVIIVDIHEQY